MIATGVFLRALESTVFGRGYGPDPAGGANSALPDFIAGLTGPTSKGKGERGEGEKKKRGGTGPLRQIPGSAQVYSL